MSSSTGGPLANYNSLTDKNLSGYFANTRMRKHLRKSGLITRDGQITSDNAYKLRIAKKEHREHVRELLANAIVDKALDMERTRQHEVRKRLDELYKIELVSKVRSERTGKSKEELYALLSPRNSKKKKRQVKSAAVTSSEKESTKLPDINFDERSKKFTYETTSMDSAASSRIFNPKPPGRSVSAKTYGRAPHPPPPKNKKKKKRKVHRGLMLAKSDQMVAHRVQVQSMAEVTMKYLGSSLNLTNDMFPANKLSEIQVIQQHCGASTVCLFREMIPPNTVFTFISRRHRGSPFGLTINIDGIKNIRISSCCEYKHKPGYRLGGKNSQFGLISVQGAAPCYRCQVRMNLLDNKKEEDKEKDASSDEEAATRSFDIIVSRGGKRQHDNRPVSANVTTQTEAEFKEENPESLETNALPEPDQTVEDYKDDFYEDEEEKDEDSDDDDINGSVSSSDSGSEQSSDSDGDKSDSDSENEEKDIEIDSSDKKIDSSETDDAKNDDITDDVLSEDKINDVSDDSSSDNKKTKQKIDIQEEDETEEEEKQENEKEEEQKEHESDSDDDESVKSKEGSYKSSSSSSESDEDNEDKTKEKGTSSGSETEENHHEVFDSMQGEDVGKDEGEKEEKEEEELKVKEEVIKSDDDEHVDIDDYIDSEDEDEDGEKRGTSVASVISRESTMLTGNEDGRCDSENKTIQFNEEVDVVHYEKIDVESANENTPRSDEEDEEEEFDTIKSGGERIVFTELGVEDDDEEIEGENQQDGATKEEVQSEGKRDKNDDEEPEPSFSFESETSDLDYLDKGYDPGCTDLNNNNNSTGHISPPREKLEQNLALIFDENFANIDLVNLELSFDQTNDFFDILKQHAKEIESLSLRNVKIEGGFQMMQDMFTEMTSLTILNLNDDDLHGEDVVFFHPILPNLQSIVLNGNPICDDGLGVLLGSLQKSNQVKSLDVGGCQLSDAGAEILCDFLSNNQSLKELILSENIFTTEGWSNIAAGLKCNSSLETISFDSCHISDAEIEILSEGIAENASLKCLDIENNMMTMKGGRSLLTAVEECSSILDVTLDASHLLSDEVVDEMRELLEQRVNKL